MRGANLLAALVGATALCVATVSAADPCPSNAVCIAGQACDSSTTTLGGGEAHFNGGVSVMVAYDWQVGHFNAYTQLPFYSPTPIEGTVEANEEFIVTGIPPGTPLSIHARIQVVASAGSAGGISPSNHASGWLQEAGAGRVETSASVEGVGSMNLDEFRSLNFPNLAGEPFRLTLGAGSRSLEGTSSASVTLSFTDLPAGALVSSCKGFFSGPPVPTRPTSWGKLKLRYR